MNNSSVQITTSALDLRIVSTNYIKEITTFDGMNKTDVKTNKLGKGYILRGSTDMTTFCRDEESNFSKNYHNNSSANLIFV
ncbi:MAG: hypothetical protein F6K48_05730 [Okeania sp. SIO3H1]|uniref:hypothetical protein n=1 Tax=Okeania sp. SIO1I7 TaxID=2607772 RepID=UPI0013C61B49|nr:hypothetical protein [Okeania sp. SIO1I7]NEN88449.1 hypothetical protein [Okeania sp. SIO3H1]NET27258.1 hypothetical protein [Okeania sp. SIO1I7]